MSDTGQTEFPRHPEIARLETEIADLRAVVDKLPKTADGVPVVPGMVLHERIGDTIHGPLNVVNVGYDFTLCRYGPDDIMATTVQREFSYSTRAAAEAAHQKGTKEHD